MFYEILTWKTSLMARLNVGVFRADEWQEFLEAARNEGCEAIAADMQARFDYYTKECKCIKRQ